MTNWSFTSTTPTNVRGALADPFVKGEIHEKKVMLSVWRGVHGCYRFELLPDNTTATAEVYCAQLQRLADKIRKEHPKLDNVRLLHAPSHREEDFPEKSGARMGSSTAATVQPGPGPQRLPPLSIALASPGREALR
ncbi:hypothetical protein RB195_014066 [Necator americanus]|uniref:Uncharacterized protein n=1 Tax=Necator americanus TaxID=51031 RepID=A0ABR1DYM1_NECAM